MKVEMTSLPRADQQQSRLLSMPAELRLKILEELLVTNSTISTRRQYPSRCIEIHASSNKPRAPPRRLRPRKKKSVNSVTDESQEEHVVMVTGIELYPQILAICQALLVEGIPLLYGKNRLGMSLQQMSPFGVPGAIVQLLAPILSPQNSTSSEVEDFARRFTHIDLDILGNPDSIWSGGVDYQQLRTKLQGLQTSKCFQDASLRLSIQPALQVLWHNEKKSRKFISLLQLIRCNTLDFVDIDTDKVALSVLDAIKRAVMSADPALDLSARLRECLRMY